MTSRDFCYWLQGHFEITGCKHIGGKQVAMIQKHLALVFKHEIDPSFGVPEQQAALNTIHSGQNPDDTLIRC